MKSQRRIGIIAGRIHKEVNRQLISGILEQAYSLGFSAYIFTLIDENHDDKTLIGEENILSLINFSLLDAMIYIPYSFSTDESREHTEEFLIKNCTVPVICISKEKHRFPSIWHDNRREFSEITEHLINVHGCRRIYCLTGPERRMVSHLRLEGYCDAMKNAGLDYSESNIIFGDFWCGAAEKLASEIAGGKRPKPDAVVCANDIMAIALCDKLTAAGFSVPDDIRITGYDGVWETISHLPPITTYRPSQKQLGRDAVCSLYKIITGMHCSPCSEDCGMLLPRKSCGCTQSESDKHLPDITYQKMEDSYLDSNLSNQLLSASSLNDFVYALCRLTYVFMDPVYYAKESYCLCLCEDWDAVSTDGQTENYRREGYSEKMLIANDLSSHTYFETSQMIPPGHLKKDIPSATFFTAVHFQDRCFGYALLTFDGIADGFNLHYLRFCREVNNGLEFLCVQNTLKSLAYRNYLSNIRDPLTGLYNANGFRQFWNDTAEKARRYNEDVFILAVTVHGMQQINEQYGRIEGDRLLAAFSGFLPVCCGSGDVCMHYAGASFVIIGSENSSAQRHKIITSKLSENVDRYNQSSGKPYRIKIHTASHIVSVASLPDYEEALNSVHEMFSRSGRGGETYSEQLYYSSLSALRREIYQHPEKKWSLDICSRRLEVSTSHFQRIYRTAFGISCMRDVQNSKLSYAKKLLLNTTDTLQSIAAKCGYDYSHFMRLFKREFGVTPTDYRNGVTGHKSII
ncbi:MAG: substrate-binding domain-containing protein [Ruminococcus sp.]|nr:substrate-binding domain-containing protein [Ruminococcus sp.]